MSNDSAGSTGPRPRSGRTRAYLTLAALAVLAPGLGAQGTFAFWTDDAVVQGGTFTAGTLDLRVNNANSHTTTTLGMANMVPGATSAEVLTMRNNGNVPLKYTLTGGLGGADAAAFGSTGALRLRIVLNGAKSGTGNTSTCTGGTSVADVALTADATTLILPKRPTGSLAATATEALCFQVTFDNAIASANQATLQGDTATATFTASATSDVS